MNYLPGQAADNQLGEPALCVDVDGTLLRTNLLYESFLSFAKQKPLLLPLVPFWLMRGKPHLKRRLARSVTLKNAHLTAHQQLLEYLKAERARGRRVVLCSGSDEEMVRRIAKQLSLSEEVLGSDGTVNLKGSAKARSLVERFGVRGFDYAGNSRDDLPIWNQARYAIVVNASRSVQKASAQQGNVEMVLPKTSGTFSALLRVIRPYQWIKNALVYLPLLTSHNILHLSLVLKATIAFIAMSLSASSIYVINDLADIETDRNHEVKRRRPFASGDLSIPIGLVLGPLLFALGICVSLALPKTATMVLLFYAALSLTYIFWLKQRLLADVIVLSLLYTVRIMLGGTATSILVSPWLLAFSLFLFLSLAFGKRVTEMLHVTVAEQGGASGRAYLSADTTIIASFGAVSGYIACLVLSFYISSDSVRLLYPHPAWLWLMLPPLLYWIGRMWLKTMRRRMSDDPILFVARDFATYVTLIVIVVALLLAMTCPFGIPGIAE
jgi:4-hydroxybenzoate polyprenyltransferase/phosphoserine phosphatase